MKTKPNIKIPFTFLPKRKYTSIQVCFLTSGTEWTCIIKMFATGKGGVPLDTLEPHFLEH